MYVKNFNWFFFAKFLQIYLAIGLGDSFALKAPRLDIGLLDVWRFSIFIEKIFKSS